ncbi:MAG: hypothetical protein A3J58_01595 [Candidatus Sungbacteria bacterium RIFCSPHIGHO2_02_FULL_52_23]|uniref:Uncharacterized protein n=1 Tax=Candidatus Sungbacteria bacterium RIFCSPHIGHO2_02_FULL_52_23 TaxID=1802274 RepID=A0A1G2KUT9_9BACT|nr:MAG: hypothetical protein A3J58_01595 [Candidatus Sungbacteria bacterium RIFCSPHIGHO2_02_FULL_52_23]
MGVGLTAFPVARIATGAETSVFLSCMSFSMIVAHRYSSAYPYQQLISFFNSIIMQYTFFKIKIEASFVYVLHIKCRQLVAFYCVQRGAQCKLARITRATTHQRFNIVPIYRDDM